MNYKQVIGVFAIIAGVVLIIIGRYITGQVEAGNLQISEAQHKVNSANSLFSRNMYTKPIGESLTSGAQSKINAGQEDVNYYTIVAGRCQLGGIALIVVGAGMVFFFRKKKK